MPIAPAPEPGLHFQQAARRRERHGGAGPISSS
jgi:hypothetical protein